MALFSLRVINDWNELPEDIVNADSTDLLKVDSIMATNMKLYSDSICLDQVFTGFCLLTWTPINNNIQYSTVSIICHIRSC